MMKIFIYTIMLVLFGITANAQVWNSFGNTVQWQKVGPDTNRRVGGASGANAWISIYDKYQVDKLLLKKDSALNINKNLFDVSNKSVARNNLGITVLLGSKADTSLYLKIVGGKLQHINGNKLFDWAVTFANNKTRIDSGGIQTNNIRRLVNNAPFGLFAPSGTNLTNSIYLQPAPIGSDTSQHRFVSGKILSFMKLQDTIIVSDTVHMKYGTITVAGSIRQTGPSLGITSAFYDQHTIVSATDYASFRTDLNSGSGYSFKFLGTAPGLTNGDIEIGTIGYGIILKSPNGTRYRITVANGGSLIVTSL